MAVNSNGLSSHDTFRSVWVLVEEAELWKSGLPNCIPTIQSETVLDNQPGIGIFSTRELAQEFIDKAGMARVRPLALNDPRMLLVILAGFVSNGIKDVFQYDSSDAVSGERRLVAADSVEFQRMLAEHIRQFPR